VSEDLPLAEARTVHRRERLVGKRQRGPGQPEVVREREANEARAKERREAVSTDGAREGTNPTVTKRRADPSERVDDERGREHHRGVRAREEGEPDRDASDPGHPA
jgi:hypothetical protein